MIEKLKADYDFIVDYKGDKDICIKYSFDYKTVNVNLYFDMFDSSVRGVVPENCIYKNSRETQLNSSTILVKSY